MSERVESSDQQMLIAALDRQTAAIGQLVAVVADLLAEVTGEGGDDDSTSSTYMDGSPQ